MNTNSSALRAAVLVCAAAFTFACVTELPRRNPRPPSIDVVTEIVVVDPVGAITASIVDRGAIERILGSWAFSSSNWRAPWIQSAPLYDIEFHVDPAQQLPPRVYGLGRAGSTWWVSSGAETAEWMKSLPPAEAGALLSDLQIPSAAQ